MSAVSAEAASSHPRTLRRDPVWIAALVVGGLSAFPLIFPLLGPDRTRTYATYFADVPLLLVLLLAMELNRRGAVHRREHDFWGLWSLAIACWLANWVLYFPFFGIGESRAVELTADLLNLLYYVFAFLAATRFPHLENPSREAPVTAPQIVGTLLFCFGLLVYFVLIPAAAAPDVYATYVPSFLMYLTLDALLLLAYVRLADLAASDGWRRIYRLFAAAGFLWLFLDAVEALQWTEVIPWVDRGTALDALWFLPYLPLLAACRVASRRSAQPLSAGAADAADAAFQRRSSRALLVAYAGILPILHFGGYALGLAEPSIRQAREACVFTAVVALGALAMLAHHRLEGERDDIEARVRQQKNRLRALSQRLARAHEDERRQIARELHDEIGQRLTAMRLSLAALRQGGNAVPARSIVPIEEEFSALQKQVRDLSLMLRPSMLDDHGLVPALKWLFGRLHDQTGLQIDFECVSDAAEMPAESQVAAFRIVQEALTNVIRHADVSRATVRLSADARAYHLEVSDAGRGFAPESLVVSAICGLDGMRERAELLGGTLNVHAAPGAGTRVELLLPRAD